ncbi:MAG: hypothetical protein IJ189_04510 [Clostridia bacterium]|nr:hypothetical protein [Clostridia bacterium]
MKRLYTPEKMAQWKKRARVSGGAVCALMAAALAACVYLCAQVRTGNAGRMLRYVIGLFTLSGWVSIVLLRFCYRPAQAEYRHMAGILAGETEEHAGTVAWLPGAFSIPKSITIRKAILTKEDGETETLNVDVRLADTMPPSGAAVRLETVRKYITAYEVQHE